ncbi:MAG: hypothetical protein KGM15_03960 [Pseudomonadota bacterium]|nr:hypothetical protein [Pseudomonadota bacterium]
MTIELLRADDWRKRGETLSRLLELEEAVPVGILVNLAIEPNHAVDLWIARADRDFHEKLGELARLPDRVDDDEGALLAGADEALDDIESVIALTVDSATPARREQACLACPALRGAARQLNALFANLDEPAPPGSRLRDLQCGLCECRLGRKLRWREEKCPQPRADGSGLSRWGEPV